MPRNRRIVRGLPETQPQEVRDALNFQRTIIRQAGLNPDPLQGEVTMNPQGEMQVWIDGQPTQIAPQPAQSVSPPTPVWVQAGWSILQEELELARIPEEDWIFYRGF